MPVQAHGQDHPGQVAMADAERKFLITIRAESDLDVHNVQDAVVMEAQRASGSDVDHGNTDVELIRTDRPKRELGDKARFLVYSVEDVA